MSVQSQGPTVRGRSGPAPSVPGPPGSGPSPAAPSAPGPARPDPGPRAVRLDDPDLPWVSVPVPGSSPPVELVRLHVDPATGASVSLVRFPPGWTRPGSGHYACAEEFVVLEGFIEVSGSRTGAGRFAYLPPRSERAGSRVAEQGCLAVAWFSAPPRWTEGPPAHPADHAAVGGPVADLARPPRPGVPGRAGVAPDPTHPPDGGAPPAAGSGGRAPTSSGRDVSAPADPGAPAPVDRDLLAPTARTWALVPAGAPAPALDGLVVVREWGP